MSEKPKCPKCNSTEITRMILGIWRCEKCNHVISSYGDNKMSRDELRVFYEKSDMFTKGWWKNH